jgi:hypothetical protein
VTVGVLPTYSTGSSTPQHPRRLHRQIVTVLSFRPAFRRGSQGSFVASPNVKSRSLLGFGMSGNLLKSPRTLGEADGDGRGIPLIYPVKKNLRPSKSDGRLGMRTILQDGLNHFAHYLGGKFSLGSSTPLAWLALSALKAIVGPFLLSPSS